MQSYKANNAHKNCFLSVFSDVITYSSASVIEGLSIRGMEITTAHGILFMRHELQDLTQGG